MGLPSHNPLLREYGRGPCEFRQLLLRFLFTPRMPSSMPRASIVPIETVGWRRFAVGRVQVLEGHDFVRSAPVVQVLAEERHAVSHRKSPEIDTRWTLQIRCGGQIEDLREMNADLFESLSEGVAVWGDLGSASENQETGAI